VPTGAEVEAPRAGAGAGAGAGGASEILGIRLDADLVILSACNTAGPMTGLGAGTSAAGEALSGLARSFFFAGARGLMVTHWPAREIAATLTVSDMARRAQQGLTTAEALRGAQLAWLDEAAREGRSEDAHPFYWAGFALIGEGAIQGGARVTDASPAGAAPRQERL